MFSSPAKAETPMSELATFDACQRREENAGLFPRQKQGMHRSGEERPLCDPGFELLVGGSWRVGRQIYNGIEGRNKPKTKKSTDMPHIQCLCYC